VAEGFKIADAYIDVEARYDRAELVAAAEKVGEQAGSGVSEGTARQMKRDSKGRFAKDVEASFDDLIGAPARKSGDRQGRSWGRSILGGMGKAVTGLGKGLFTDKLVSSLGGGLMSFVKSPVGLGVIATAAGTIGTLLASGIASTLTVGLGAGLGLGFIGLGALLLKDEPAIQRGIKRIGNTFKNVFGGAAKTWFLGPMTQALAVINTLLNNLRNPINAIFKALAPSIVPLTEGFSAMVLAMTPGLVALMQRVGPFLIDLAGKLPALGASISKFLTDVATNWPAIQAGFFSFMSDLGVVLGFLAGAFLWLAKNYQGIRDWTARLVQAVQPAVTLTRWIYDAFKWLYDVLIGHSIVPDLVNGIVRWFAQLPGRVIGAIASLPGRVAGLFSSMATAAINRARSLVSSVISTLATLPSRAYSAASGIVGRISTLLGSAASTARSRAGQLVSGFVGVLAGLPGKAAAQANRVRGAVVGAFGGAAGWLRSAGSRIMDGLVGGIQSGISRVRGLLNSVTGMIPDWKGPPERDSKLLRDNGRRIITGFRKGLADEIPKVKADLSGLTARVPSMAAGAAGNSTTVNSGGNISIGQVVLQVPAGVTEPKAWARAAVAALYAQLKEYERSYA
jgi:hypothetical protein